MKLAEICIKRPVLAIVISLVLTILGILGYNQLQLRAEPNVFHAHLRISIEAQGSSAEYIEKNAVTPLEERMQGVQNLSYMSSQSDQDFGSIKLYFKNISPEQFVSSETEVLQAISSLTLPQAITSVKMHSGISNTQIMFAVLSSKTMGQHQLVDYAHNTVIKLLGQTPGVGEVYQQSTQNALRINLKPQAMAQYKISPTQIIDAINSNNTAQPAGQIVNLQQTIPINLNSRLSSLQSFKKIILKKTGYHVVRLSDVANIEIDHLSYAGAFTLFNNQQGVGINIQAADDADPIATGQRIEAKIKELNAHMPPGTAIHVVYNDGEILKSSVTEVYLTIIESIVLVGIITLLFLGKPRFAFIPIITIPVCIITTFAVMWLLGFSLNLISLLALVLAVGLVVDDAIVVLENCHRYIEQGLPIKQAALVSLKQIIFPVIAMTISLFAVFVPSAFLKGKAAVYIQQFSFTLAAAVIISGFIAVTLTPMMCSRLLSTVKHNGYDAAITKFFTALSLFYKKILINVLKKRFYVVALFFILLILGYFVFSALPTTLLPNEYGGYLFAGIKAPDSASVAYTKKIERPYLQQLLKKPAIKNIMSFGGGNGNDSSFVTNIIELAPGYHSYSETVNVATALQNEFQNNDPRARFIVVPMNLGIGNDDSDGNDGSLEFFILGNDTYKHLSAAIDRLVTKLKKTPYFADVVNDISFDSQQVQISINHQLAALLNVPIANINNAISVFYGGYEINDGYQFSGVNYPVILQLPHQDITDFSALDKIFIYSSDGLPIALSRLVSIKSELSLSSRNHVNSIRAGALVVTPKPQYTTGQIVQAVNSIAKNVLPSAMTLQNSFEVQHMMQGNATLSLLFALGLIFIYLVLAALYESFIDPLIILFTVPLCVVGALVVLKLIGGSLNLYTGVGLITLIGLVSKHGVLIVQFANEMVKEGEEIFAAVVQAAVIRLRPILMTTTTMIIGAVPLLFFSNIGSNGRMQLATVIIAGLLFGTFFSLFVVPVTYTIFKKGKSK